MFIRINEKCKLLNQNNWNSQQRTLTTHSNFRGNKFITIDKSKPLSSSISQSRKNCYRKMEWAIEEAKAKKTNDLINLINNNKGFKQNTIYLKNLKTAHGTNSQNIKRISNKFFRDNNSNDNYQLYAQFQNLNRGIRNRDGEILQQKSINSQFKERVVLEKLKHKNFKLVPTKKVNSNNFIRIKPN